MSETLGAEGDMAAVWDTLAGLRDGGHGSLRVFRPAPTAAFSRLDSLRPGYGKACEAVSDHGFTAVLRPAGGHLAVYDKGSVVVDLVAPLSDGMADPMARFAHFTENFRTVFGRLGLDLKVGALPNEYCPGKFSLHAEGRKVVGLAQRATKHGFHMGAIIMVGPAAAPRAAMEAAYPHLDLPLDAFTIGSLSDLEPGLTCEEVMSAVLVELQGNGTILRRMERAETQGPAI